MSKLDQKQFNVDHAEPREYGYGAIVVGDQFTDEQAAETINKWDEDLSGENPNYTANDIMDLPIVIGRNEDGGTGWNVHINAKSGDIVAWGKGISL